MIRQLIIFLALLLFFALPSLAADDVRFPPELPNTDENAWTLKDNPVSNVTLGKLLVKFEDTTLGAVQKSAGAGIIQFNGKDAAGGKFALCYTVTSPDSRQRLWFSSNAEMGGNDHDIDDFYAVADSNMAPASEDCPELPVKGRPVSLSNSLWLGSSVDQVNSLLGEPSSKKGKWWIYSYMGERLGQPPNQYDTLAEIRVEIDKGKVIALYEGQRSAN